MLRLRRTPRFSVFEAVEVAATDGEDDEHSPSGWDDFGSDVPLGDMAVQILMENMNLAPRAATARAVALETVALPWGTTLRIEQDTLVSRVGVGGTGGVIWNAAHACIAYLAFRLPALLDEMENKRGQQLQVVLELGSGTGLLGIAMAHLLLSSTGRRRGGGGGGAGFEVILSDTRNVVPLLKRNADRNPVSAGGGRFECIACDWNSDADRAKALARMQQPRSGDSDAFMVLCSDLVFGNRHDQLIDFLATLQSTLGGAERCSILFAFEERADRYPSPGFQEALRRSFHVDVAAGAGVPDANLPEGYRERWPRIELFWLTARDDGGGGGGCGGDVQRTPVG